MSLYLTRTLATSYEQAMDDLRIALLSHGFRLESEITVTSAHDRQLEIPYRILAISTPRIQFPRGRGPEPSTGIPLHIVVQHDRNGAVMVSAMDPARVMLAAYGDSHREEAEMARGLVLRLLNELESCSRPLQVA